MTDEQIEEAVTSVMVSVGTSAFLHGIEYSEEKFQGELGRIASYMQSRL